MGRMGLCGSCRGSESRKAASTLDLPTSFARWCKTLNSVVTIVRGSTTRTPDKTLSCSCSDAFGFRRGPLYRNENRRPSFPSLRSLRSLRLLLLGTMGPRTPNERHPFQHFASARRRCPSGCSAGAEQAMALRAVRPSGCCASRVKPRASPPMVLVRDAAWSLGGGLLRAFGPSLGLIRL